jgi:hypothetical protein
MKRKYVVDVSEILKEAVKLTGKEWNDVCNEIYFCRYENNLENWSTDEIEELLKDEPARIDMLALKALMKEYNVKEVLITNDLRL